MNSGRFCRRLECISSLVAFLNTAVLLLVVYMGLGGFLRLFMLLVLLDTAPVLYLALGFPKGEAITWRGKLAVTLLTVAYDVFLIFLAYHASFSLERSATLLYNPELLVSAFFFTFLSGAALTFLLIDLAGYCDPKRLWKLWNSYMRCITILAIVGLFLKLIL